MRRLESAAGRLRGLIRSDAQPIPRGDAAEDEPPVAVVHLARLHEFAQRFVVGTLLAQTFAAKEAGQRDPIEFVVLDELNKYAPREGDSPIKDTLIDIAQRGRSLGVILIGAQQQASLVAPEVTQNAAIRIAGRLDAAEAERSEYGWLGAAARARARLLMQGRVLLSQPSVPAPIAVEVPFPPWATTSGEVSRTELRGVRLRRVRVRLLHTGDWHLGKRLYGADRAEEARAALAEVAELAGPRGGRTRCSSPAICSTGASSNSAALGDCLTALERLAAVAPVIAVTGQPRRPGPLGPPGALPPRQAASTSSGNVRAAGRRRPDRRHRRPGPLHAGAACRGATPRGWRSTPARAPRRRARRYADRVGGDARRRSGAEAVRRRREDGGVAVLRRPRDDRPGRWPAAASAS